MIVLTAFGVATLISGVFWLFLMDVFPHDIVTIANDEVSY